MYEFERGPEQLLLRHTNAYALAYGGILQSERVLHKDPTVNLHQDLLKPVSHILWLGDNEREDVVNVSLNFSIYNDPSLLDVHVFQHRAYLVVFPAYLLHQFGDVGLQSIHLIRVKT